MAIFSCISALVGKKKKSKSKKEFSKPVNTNNDPGTLQVGIEHCVCPFKEDNPNSTSFSVSVPFAIQGSSTCKVKVVKVEKDLSDIDLQFQAANKEEETDLFLISRKSSFFDSIDAVTNDEPQRYKEGIEAIQHRHSSNSGMGRTEFSGSPKLKRLCSHLETMDMLKMIADLRISVRDERSKFTQGIQPRYIGNILRTLAVKDSGTKELSRLNISGLLNGESRNKSGHDNWDCTNIHDVDSALWPQKQWLAVSIDSSSLSRVDEWMNVIPEKTSHITHHSNLDLSEEVIKENNIIKFLNSFTSTARIAGMGLKVIPNISHFASLPSVNLSGNSIGLSNCTLIKELYLSGNKIGEVEGLHRLLKLRILDLSFNKITMTKALGQLFANFHSLLVLNLLRKAVSSLLPQLAYLSKLQLNRQRARGATMDHVAKATLGNDELNV
ncbi:Leucine-rich repeat-containing protein ODA7 [Cinnamomum micranthum f. kanehirae]|uniref:Leucine-rich repeat-containing protein ODA7 n=1 Tax=Cinnamomum micranthum f. kanehirae TaxID=337451 RepID=A0A443PNT1_9MAGN|nr:Leucine-rich repeat-containing protein ODA7 [Cinnamomum micranthum f. kanehirae]